MSLYLIAK